MEANEKVLKDSGWETFTPQGPHGKFSMYMNQLVALVIVTTSQKNKAKRNGKIYLTDAVMKALGYPKYIRTLVRGEEIGLMAVNTEDRAYAVQNKEGTKNATPFITCTSFINQNNIAGGAYNLHEETGILVFSKLSRPSRI